MNNQLIKNKYIIDKLSYLNKFLEEQIIDVEFKINKIEDENTLHGDFQKFINFITEFIKQKGGVENIFLNYEFDNGNKASLIQYLKKILLLKEKNILIERDEKRYFLGSFPVSNYVFKTILNFTENEEIKLNLDFLGNNNPFKLKYNGEKLETLVEKFECLRDYINEVSHSVDAPGIGGMAGATDFIQLYKYVMFEEIIKKNHRDGIIIKLFEVLNSNNVENFIENYNDFKELLKEKNITNDKRLSRLYNRLYYIFSFVLNSLKPEYFTIYFGKTRTTLSKFDIAGYVNVCNVYKEIGKNKIILEKKYIENYIKEVGIKNNNFILKENIFIKFDEDLFTKFAKYRFFQDICYILYEKVIDGQDFINNYKDNSFKLKEIEDKNYFTLNKIKNEKTETKIIDILDINFLISEGYIIEKEPGLYNIRKRDNYLKNIES